MSEEIIIHIDQAKADTYYGQLRDRIVNWMAQHERERLADFLLLAPDLLVLLVRLGLDSRLPLTDRAIVAGGVAYFLSPIDLIPDFIFPVGVADDVVVAVIALNAVLNRTDPQILREHWEGDDEILDVIQRTLSRADALLGKGLMKRLSVALSKRTPDVPEDHNQ